MNFNQTMGNFVLNIATNLQKGEVMKKFAYFLVLLFLLSACGVNKTEYKESASSTLESFMRAFNIAGQTPRMSLTAPILNMEDARQEWDDIELPKCAEKGHETVSNGMDEYISGYLAFQGQDSETTVNTHFRNGDRFLENGQKSIIDECGFDDWSVWR